MPNEDSGDLPAGSAYAPNGVSLPVLHPDFEISHLVRQVPDGSPVRCAAERLLAGEMLASLAPLFEALHGSMHGRWPECTVAAWALGRAAESGEQKRDAALVLADVVREPSRWQWWRHVRTSLVPSALVAAPVTVWIYYFSRFPSWWTATEMRTDAAVHQVMYTALIVPCVAAWMAHQERGQRDQLRSVAAGALAELADLSALGTLASACRTKGGAVYAAARSALIALLQRVGPEHYGALGGSALSELCATLRSGDSLLASHVLRALEHVGTRSTVPELERLVASGANPSLRDEAARVLAVVRARADEEAQHDRLLRPASSPHEHLLRPAPNAQTDDPDLLLRAAAGEEDAGR